MTLPALFLGHGNPMNALGRNVYTEAWSGIGRSLPRPKAVLCVSAHWYVAGPAVTVNTAPRTIHDFGGFPAELYQVQYPAPGDPDLARRVRSLLTPAVDVALDESWGLDHGTWSVMCHLYPDADIPVVQLSIDGRQPGEFHYEIGRRLAELRQEGVLILGSGNVVHNLRAYAWGQPEGTAPPYDWAVRFEDRAKELLMGGDFGALADWGNLGAEARLAIPTPDHYLPLLYVLGAGEGSGVTLPVEGIEGGSVSMLGVQLG